MIFPTSGGGRPYVRIDGRTGAWALSVHDGEPKIVAMKGSLVDLDLVGAEQGWLRLGTDGADWQPLAARDDWTSTPRPSADHNPGVRIDLMCADWPDPKVRELRGSSRAITGFIAQVAEQAGDVPAGRAVRIRIGAAKPVRFGKGSSVVIGFEIAPPDKWPDVATFDAHREAAESAAAAAPNAAGAAPDFADMAEDSVDAWT
jgi:hypothetical protein